MNNSDQKTFAGLCKLAIRPSIDSNAVVYMEPLLKTKPRLVNAAVHTDKYELNMEVYTCPVIIYQTYSSSSSSWQITNNTDTKYILDTTMYALAQGPNDTSLLLLKRIESTDTETTLEYEFVELILEVFQEFIDRIDFKTRWKQDKN